MRSDQRIYSFIIAVEPMLSGGIYLWQMITKAKSLNNICIAGFISPCFDKKNNIK